MLVTDLKPDGSVAKSSGYGAASGSIAGTMVVKLASWYKPNSSKWLSLVLDYTGVSYSPIWIPDLLQRHFCHGWISDYYVCGGGILLSDVL